MAKIKKKGQAGQAKNYITRTQAVRKLQISLPDFRRLCIFKGIYPREPRNLKKANKSATHSTTFYYTKDIQYLLHEPLLSKFRDQKALSKKIARALGRNEVQDAAKLEKHGTPKMQLDHIVRERYPTFTDALRDLDDCLSLLFLFANLPSTPNVPSKVISKCQRLCHEFEHYLIETNALRKSFLSIKGIYYQATIQGQDVMWLVPYRFVQRVTQDIDYRIMGTFVEFYCTLLGFVNYRLYSSIGLVYPPRFDVISDEKGAELAAFTLENRQLGNGVDDNTARDNLENGHARIENSATVQAQIDMAAGLDTQEQVVGDEAPVDDREGDAANIDKFEVVGADADELVQPDISARTAGTLFTDLTFYISREAPRHPVEFLLRAFGCKRIGWDAVLGGGSFTTDENDPRITHQVVDRPVLIPPLPSENAVMDQPDQQVQIAKGGSLVPGRIYVQPQWIWDSINEAKLQRTDLYGPGATLPPHISPWIKPSNGQYDPRATLEEQQPEGEADEISEDENEELDEFVEAREHQLIENGIQTEPGDEVDAGDMDIARSVDENDADSDTGDEVGGAAFGGFDDAHTEEQSEDDESRHQRELEQEAAGKPLTSTKAAKTPKEKHRIERQAKQDKAEEELERQKMMMSRKKRKLYEKMQYGNNKRDAESEKLRKKRRKLEQKAL